MAFPKTEGVHVCTLYTYCYVLLKTPTFYIQTETLQHQGHSYCAQWTTWHYVLLFLLLFVVVVFFLIYCVWHLWRMATEFHVVRPWQTSVSADVCNHWSELNIYSKPTLKLDNSLFPQNIDLKFLNGVSRLNFRILRRDKKLYKYSNISPFFF